MYRLLKWRNYHNYQGPSLQNILRLSYNNAIIMTDFLRYDLLHLQNCKLVLDSIHKLAAIFTHTQPFYSSLDFG